MFFETDNKKGLEIKACLNGIWLVTNLKTRECLYRGTDKKEAFDIYNK